MVNHRQAVYHGDTMPNVLTTVEASQRYHVSTRYLRRLMEQGTLRGRRSGVIWLIDELSLKAFFAKPRPRGPKPKRLRKRD